MRRSDRWAEPWPPSTLGSTGGMSPATQLFAMKLRGCIIAFPSRHGPLAIAFETKAMGERCLPLLAQSQGQSAEDVEVSPCFFSELIAGGPEAGYVGIAAFRERNGTLVVTRKVLFENEEEKES